MKLIVGLGNPGKKYDNTRHNIGFNVLDFYVNKNNLSYKQKLGGLYAENTIKGEKIILLKPQSYMNLSGDVVRKYFDYFNINVEDMLIIYDDVYFDTGTFRIKRDGSSGGHNGIKDIISKIGTEDIYRVRVGTSKNEDKLYDYVLGKVSKEDRIKIDSLYPILYDAINDFTILSIDELMCKYNKKEKNE